MMWNDGPYVELFNNIHVMNIFVFKIYILIFLQQKVWKLSIKIFFFFNPHPRTLFPLLLEREERKKEGSERNINARVKH